MSKYQINTLNFSYNYFDSYLKLRDGIKLISRIWVPDGQGPWPALLMRQPYGRQIASSLTYAHPTWWTSKGYLVIIQDVRGQGESEGVFQGFSQEARDTSDTHEWVRSLDLCDGGLGLYGFSYQGITQLTGEDNSLPPDCLAPAMTGLDIQNHWASDGNSYWWHNNILWALQMTALKVKREKNVNAWNNIRETIENNTYLSIGLDLVKKYDSNNFIIKWMEIINSQKESERIKPLDSWLKKPMLIFGGLWDPHLKGAIDLYKQSLDLGGEPEIFIGNATHLEWWQGSQETLLNFFDGHLKNKHNKKKANERNKKIWNISLERWDELERENKNKYFFGFEGEGISNVEIKDGSLVENRKGSGFTILVHDPWRPSPMNGGHLGRNPGMFDRGSIDKRFDIAVFQTNILEKEILISGIPMLETSVISDCESYDICLALSVVDSENSSVKQFSTGFLRVKSTENLKEAVHKIALHPTHITLKKGNKLRISIAGAGWPVIGVNPGSSDHNCGAPTINHKVITIKYNLEKTFMKILPFF